MKCPKCDYIGFASGERCRNCGYEFSLASHAEAPEDLPIRSTESLGPLADLSLKVDDGLVPDEAAPPAAGVRVADADLPLFLDQSIQRAFDSDRRPPRPPLSVRRATPEVARVRTAVRRARAPAPALELGSAVSSAGDVLSGGLPGEALAPRLRRLLAAAIDLAVLTAIDAGVVLLTLRLCALSPAEWASVPLPPLGVFLSILNGGYLVAFTTAGGQTIGKMLCGIKVVGADGSQVRPSAAIVRAMAFLISVVPLGLGFFAQFADRQRRALHDRLAETRVVKVS